MLITISVYTIYSNIVVAVVNNNYWKCRVLRKQFERGKFDVLFCTVPFIVYDRLIINMTTMLCKCRFISGGLYYFKLIKQKLTFIILFINAFIFC